MLVKLHSSVSHLTYSITIFSTSSTVEDTANDGYFQEFSALSCQRVHSEILASVKRIRYIQTNFKKKFA